MQLSQKKNIFSNFVAAFWKSRLNFKCYNQKDDRHRFFIFEITDSKNVA